MNSQHSLPMTLRTSYLDYKKPSDYNDNDDGKKERMTKGKNYH